MKTTIERLALASLLAALPLSAQADTVATYLMQGDKNARQMTVSYKNEQSVRMDVGEGNYMLVSGSKVYMVSNRNGEITAVDMDSMPKFGAMPKTESKPTDAKVTKTGRTETIAGVPGEVWEMVDAEGKKHEMVVSTDKRVQGIGKAFLAFAKRMNQAIGGHASLNDALREAQRQGGGGAMLRADQAMVLQSVTDKSLPAGHYQLPAGAQVQQIPKMPAGGGMPQMDPATMKKMQEAMQKAMQQQQGR